MCPRSRAIILDLTPGMDPSVSRIKRFVSRPGYPIGNREMYN